MITILILDKIRDTETVFGLNSQTNGGKLNITKITMQHCMSHNKF